MQLHLSYFSLLAILLSMVALGLSQRAVDWRQPFRSCPSCGRDLDRDCRCRPRTRANGHR
jgi:hypothetical protein